MSRLFQVVVHRAGFPRAHVVRGPPVGSGHHSGAQHVRDGGSRRRRCAAGSSRPRARGSHRAADRAGRRRGWPGEHLAPVRAGVERAPAPPRPRRPPAAPRAASAIQVKCSASAVAAVTRAQPEVVGRDRADLADLQHRRDPIADRVQRPQRGDRRGARHQVLGLQLLAAARRELQPEVRQPRRATAPARRAARCSVAGSTPAIGCRGPSAGRAPPPAQPARAGSSTRCLTHTCSSRLARHVGEQADAVGRREHLVGEVVSDSRGRPS